MPSTSEVRRALRVSHSQLLFPPVTRPEHIPKGEHGFYSWIVWPAGELLEPHVPPNYRPPYYPHQARRQLLVWCQEISELIKDSSRGRYSLWRVAQAAPTLIPDMQCWLDGVWSTREAFIELVWRLDLGERTIGAALWLHRLGDDGTGRRGVRNI